MMESHPGVSDLLFSVGRPFQVESYGELKQVDMHPDVQQLTPNADRDASPSTSSATTAGSSRSCS